MKRWLTIAQVVDAYPLTERHLRGLIYQRRVAYTKVGSRVFLDAADVDRLFDTGRVEATTPSPLSAVPRRGASGRGR